MSALPIRRVVLYKHGVGHFEREGHVEGDTTLALTFKQSEVSDVLKSLTVLDLDGGHIASVSYDSTKPLEQLLSEVALSIPDQGSVVGLIPQIKGARIALHTGVQDPVEGVVLGIDTNERQTGDGVVRIVLVSVLTDRGEVRSYDLHQLASLQILDAALRRDLDFYLRTQLSSKKKDSRAFTFFAQGQGKREIRLSYTLEAPVWKATYRILMGEEGKPPMIQGWAVVDNTQDEDWEGVELSLISGLPVSFVHDLYTPRYIRRPVVAVRETTGVLPPEVESGMMSEKMFLSDETVYNDAMAGAAAPMAAAAPLARGLRKMEAQATAKSSVQVQTRERKVGDLFAYEIEHPVSIHRNQSALVPIVLRPFEGKPVLLYNKSTRADNPMRCVEFKNTTGLTLEGGPVSVLEGGSYVGEAMLETTKPDEQRLVPYAVELGVSVLDNVDSQQGTVQRVVVRNKMLTAFRQQVMQTTYHFNNKSESEQIVYLDHPRQMAEWQLVDTATPHEITENFWRFRFVIPARKVTAFVVKQQFLSQFQHGLVDIGDNHLHLWMEQRYFDAPTLAALREVVELRKQAGRAEQRIVLLQQEREAIHAEQKRIRENLQSLGDRSTEKDLRERFVRTLNEQEDRLIGLEKETKSQIQLRDGCREKIEAALEKLAYDAKV